jgi:hypothetical protein
VTPYQFHRDIPDKSVDKVVITDREIQKMVTADRKMRRCPSRPARLAGPVVVKSSQ